mmetsp:Transcript_40676/g.85455  ORF Transcript_40676/g.85455 Transcript_40676/m.85455 type:complete len:173 (+) Transcript_40676:423-941(+)
MNTPNTNDIAAAAVAVATNTAMNGNACGPNHYDHRNDATLHRRKQKGKWPGDGNGASPAGNMATGPEKSARRAATWTDLPLPLGEEKGNDSGGKQRHFRPPPPNHNIHNRHQEGHGHSQQHQHQHHQHQHHQQPDRNPEGRNNHLYPDQRWDYGSYVMIEENILDSEGHVIW